MAKAESRAPSQEALPDSAAPSKADLARLKLKVIANHVATGFAPIAAAAALAMAVAAIVATQSAQTQSGDAATRLEKLNATLNANRIEVEKLKTELAQSRALGEEARRQQGEQAEMQGKMVQAISHLQTKLKVSPTLEEQLHQPASAPAAVSAAPAPVAAAAPASPAPKSSPQIQALKEALEKFNKK